jgi:hypothetical protein
MSQLESTIATLLWNLALALAWLRTGNLKQPRPEGAIVFLDHAHLDVMRTRTMGAGMRKVTLPIGTPDIAVHEGLRRRCPYPS